MEIISRTTGLGVDLDGYTVRINMSTPRSIGIDDTVRYHGVLPGAYELQLSDVADNCEPARADTVITVEVADTSVFDISVLCRVDLEGRLVISSEAYGLPQLLAMRPDGTQRYRVFNDQFSNGAPALSPDGSRLVYASFRTGGWHLFAFETATGSITALPRPGVMEFQPAISPDGSRIAFEVMTTNAVGDQAFRIWIMGASGENPTALTTGGPSEPSDLSPAWSPDGQWIVFNRNGTLHRMHPDGTMLSEMACSPGPCGHPAWSPDGSALAYTGFSDESGDGIGDNYDIYVMDLASGDTQRLTTSLDQEDTPRWSPDGSAIAYHWVLQGRIQIFRMQSDGTGATNLSNLPSSEGQPAWGPLP